MITITTASGHLRVGNIITYPFALLSRRERFRMWLRRPWRWPPMSREGTFVVRAVCSENSFEVEGT